MTEIAGKGIVRSNTSSLWKRNVSWFKRKHPNQPRYIRPHDPKWAHARKRRFWNGTASRWKESPRYLWESHQRRKILKNAEMIIWTCIKSMYHCSTPTPPTQWWDVSILRFGQVLDAGRERRRNVVSAPDVWSSPNIVKNTQLSGRSKDWTNISNKKIWKLNKGMESVIFFSELDEMVSTTPFLDSTTSNFSYIPTTIIYNF